MSDKGGKSKNQPTELKQDSAVDNIVKILRCFKDPVDDALKILQCFKTETSTEIRPIERQAGLTTYKQQGEISEGSVHFENLSKLVKLWFSDKLAEKFLEAINMETWLRPRKDETAEAFFRSPIGGKTCQTLELWRIRQGDSDPGDNDKNKMVIGYRRKQLSINFEIGPLFMLVTKTRSTFFKNKREDTLVAVPPALTENHLKMLREAESYFHDEEDDQGPYKKLKIN